MTPNYTAFYFFDSGASRTHIVAWDANIKKWIVPCQHVEVPQGSRQKQDCPLHPQTWV